MHAFRIGVVSLWVAISLMVTIGCSRKPGNGRPKPVPVNGLVLVDDVPSEGTRVVFTPDDHKYAAAGRTDKNGRFRLQTFDAGDGAVPGSFKILVSNFVVIENPNGSVTETHFLPEHYRNPMTSGLSAVVSEKGPNEVTLKLTIPKSGIKQPVIPVD